MVYLLREDALTLDFLAVFNEIQLLNVLMNVRGEVDVG